MSSKVLEIEEKTIDGAIEKACREFGVPREKLNIEIISEGSNGFLGLMAKKAKIRASLSVLSFEMDFAINPPSIPKPDLKKDPANEQIPPYEVKPEHHLREHRHEPKRHEKPETKTDARHENKPDLRQKSEYRHIKSSQHVQRQQTPRHEPPADIKPADDMETKTPKPLLLPDLACDAVEASSPNALKAKELLAGILNHMTFQCQVKAMETNDTIILNISGDESGLLIGRRGQNLDALQYILNKAVNRSETDRKMIVVDSEEYRQRRKESLLNMAERIREKVKKTQKPLSLAHMNAHDRRIIHLALQSDDALVTKSRGEGEFRKVIVLPAKKSSAGGHPKAKSRQP